MVILFATMWLQIYMQLFDCANIFENIFSCKGPEQIELIFHISSPELFISTLFAKSLNRGKRAVTRDTAITE
mgnify:CR=1 FL=1